MVIREYRIPFPATVEEYRIGMLYMISRATEEERVRRGGGAVIDVVKQERYYDSDRGIHGVYTEKVWHVGQMLPGFMRVWIPEAKSILIEKAWNGFPEHCLTVYEAPYFGDAFHLSIESRYTENEGGIYDDNALNLSASELQQREVVVLNIASERQVNMTPETDVREFRSKLSRRPILDEGGIWMRKGRPLMCCYRVCRFEFRAQGWPGKRIEDWGLRHGVENSFVRYNRKVLCWMDSWLGLKIGDVERTGLGMGMGKAGGGQRAVGRAGEGGGECSAGLAFARSDETNPFLC